MATEFHKLQVPKLFFPLACISIFTTLCMQSILLHWCDPSTTLVRINYGPPV